MTEKIFIKNRKGQKITVVVERSSTSLGLAFIMHGLGGFKEQEHIQAMAEAFKEKGMIAVLFDTTNSLGESGGKYEDATMQNYHEDLIDVVAWAKGQGWYNEPFVLSGHSLGGYAVLRYAQDHPSAVKGVFAFAPVVSGRLSFEADDRRDPSENKTWKESGWRVRTSNSKPGVEMRLPWSHMEERLKHDLMPNVLKLTMPVLIIVGESDASCPPDHQRIFYDALPGPKEMHVIKNAPHTFHAPEHLAQVKNLLSAWLEKILH